MHGELVRSPIATACVRCVCMCVSVCVLYFYQLCMQASVVYAANLVCLALDVPVDDFLSMHAMHYYYHYP